MLNILNVRDPFTGIRLRSSKAFLIAVEAIVTVAGNFVDSNEYKKNPFYEGYEPLDILMARSLGDTMYEVDGILEALDYKYLELKEPNFRDKVYGIVESIIKKATA